jgi:hypothetical protein
VPAAAVIPAPIAYTKIVAVKKLVVESRALLSLGPLVGQNWWSEALSSYIPDGLNCVV